jgi:hypothetical protein
MSDVWRNDLCRAIKQINSKHSVSSPTARRNVMIIGRWGDVETEFSGDKSVFGGAKTVLMYLVIPTRWLLHRVVRNTQKNTQKNSRIANQQC